MYPLMKKINIDLIREIYHYNNYSKLDMEFFKFLHKDKMKKVLIDLHYSILGKCLSKVYALHLCRDRYRYPTRIALN